MTYTRDNKQFRRHISRLADTRQTHENTIDSVMCRTGNSRTNPDNPGNPEVVKVTNAGPIIFAIAWNLPWLLFVASEWIQGILK